MPAAAEQGKANLRHARRQNKESVTVDETLLENLGYIIFFILFVLPRLLKGFKKKPSAETPAPQEVDESEPGPVIIFDEPDTEELESDLGLELADDEELQRLSQRAARALVKAENLVQLCSDRGGGAARLGPTVSAACVPSSVIILSR